jgi:hypothetical protein
MANSREYFTLVARAAMENSIMRRKAGTWWTTRVV